MDPEISFIKLVSPMEEESLGYITLKDWIQKGQKTKYLQWLLRDQTQRNWASQNIVPSMLKNFVHSWTKGEII